MNLPCFFLAICTIVSISVQAQQTASLPQTTDSLKKVMAEVKEANRLRMAKASIQHFIIKADSSTYGYSIYIDGQLYIQQKTIPAMPGNRGFATIAAAEKTVSLVLQKIKEGELPPMLTVAELRQKKIID